MKTTDTRTLHRINNVCCAVAREKIITGGVNSIKVTWGFRDVYPGLSQNIDPMLNLLGKMNLQTPCWINWNLLDRTPVVSILLFPRAVIKQFINWLMSKIFWNTVRNFFFLRANHGYTKFLKHLTRILWCSRRWFSSAWVKTRQAKRHRPPIK